MEEPQEYPGGQESIMFWMGQRSSGGDDLGGGQSPQSLAPLLDCEVGLLFLDWTSSVRRTNISPTT